MESRTWQLIEFRASGTFGVTSLKDAHQKIDQLIIVSESNPDLWHLMANVCVFRISIERVRFARWNQKVGGANTRHNSTLANLTGSLGVAK